jgi:histidinol-phosphate aminotransferase
VRERQRVIDALAAAGCPVPPSEGNFVWLPLGEASGRFAAACEREGLLVHAFGDEGVRATITTPDSNDLLVQVVSSGSWA